MKSLQELGCEYLDQARDIRDHIAPLRKHLKKLRGNELLELRRRIFNLYAMARECSETGNRLINYYGVGTNE